MSVHQVAEYYIYINVGDYLLQENWDKLQPLLDDHEHSVNEGHLTIEGFYDEIEAMDLNSKINKILGL